MQFKLKELKHGLKNQFTPQESIVDYIRCKNCNSRETSNLSVGLSVRGLQIWCDNCDHNVLHLQLTGTILTIHIDMVSSMNGLKLILGMNIRIILRLTWTA